jgi:predicted transport protein
MHPDFENIEFAEIEDETMSETEDVQYTEEYHLEGVSETVRSIYTELKAHILSVNPSIVFIPQKYYISIRKERNIAFFIINRKKARLIVMQSDTETRNEIKFHSIKTLTEKVQKFWNGPSCAIVLETSENLNEVKTLLSKLVTGV